MNISTFISHVERIKYISSVGCIMCAAFALSLLDSESVEPFKWFMLASLLFAGATRVANNLLQAAKMRRFKMRRERRIKKELKVS